MIHPQPHTVPRAELLMWLLDDVGGCSCQEGPDMTRPAPTVITRAGLFMLLLEHLGDYCRLGRLRAQDGDLGPARDYASMARVNVAELLASLGDKEGDDLIPNLRRLYSQWLAELDLALDSDDTARRLGGIEEQVVMVADAWRRQLVA